MVRAFTRNLAQLDAQKGGKFSLFDGNVSGEFTDLVKQTLTDYLLDISCNVSMLKFKLVGYNLENCNISK